MPSMQFTPDQSLSRQTQSTGVSIRTSSKVWPTGTQALGAPCLM